MSETSEARFEKLERQVRRLRALVLVLAVAFAAILTATTNPDELTLKRLAIVDDKGRERIVAEALPTDEAAVIHLDHNGNGRIIVGTFPDGRAAVAVSDHDGKPRIVAGTGPDGVARLGVLDQSGKETWGELSQ